MAMPDYTDEQLAARSTAREMFPAGTRVRHLYTGNRTGTLVKLHTGTLKRPRPLARWTASVTWDGGKTTIHALDLLRHAPR